MSIPTNPGQPGPAARPSTVTISGYLLYAVAAILAITGLLSLVTIGPISDIYSESYAGTELEGTESFVVVGVIATLVVNILLAIGLAVLAVLNLKGKNVARIIRSGSESERGLGQWLHYVALSTGRVRFSAAHQVPGGALCEIRRLIPNRFPSFAPRLTRVESRRGRPSSMVSGHHLTEFTLEPNDVRSGPRRRTGRRRRDQSRCSH